MKAHQEPIVVVMGLPGSGKTTLARLLTAHLAASHLSSDHLRTEMGMRGQYDLNSRDQIYQELARRAQESVENGETVVIDATFQQQKWRNHFQHLAWRNDRPFCLIHIHASEKVIRKRVAQKRRESDADVEVYQCYKKTQEPLLLPHLDLDSSAQLPEDMLVRTLNYLHHEQRSTTTTISGHRS